MSTIATLHDWRRFRDVFGVFIFTLILGVLSTFAAQGADEPLFEVSVDRQEIGLDESVALKFRVVTSEMNGVEEPSFEAPDFDVVNQYSSVFVESFYENGRFGVRNNRKITKVLRPSRQGALRISGIRLRVGSKVLERPAITVTVSASGSGTPPPPRYGGGGAGLRGAAKRPSGANLPFFVRAEVDQSKVYKGQQVVVSYYLYQRAQVHQIQVDKYPVLDGFLREDLELPILGQRLTDRESVVLDGVAYQRVLLARYAAYPLKEGKLNIDSMAIKANYFEAPGGLSESQDPMMDVFQNFMQQMQPRSWSHRSDLVPVEVLPIPLEGRPTSFTGGVGDFEISSAVDKSVVRVNEPLTVTIQIEGKGNIAAIGQPPVKWPSDLEVYETKTRTTSPRGGVSAKIFEILLIPRRPGKLVIPAQELAFFSPTSKQYQQRQAPLIEVQVEGSMPVTQEQKPTDATATGEPSKPRVSVGLEGLVLPEQWTSAMSSSSPLARVLSVLMVGLSGLALLGLVLLKVGRRRGLLRSLRGAGWGKSQDLGTAGLRSLELLLRDQATLAWGDVVRFYQELAQVLGAELERRLNLPARSWSRNEIRRAVEVGAEEDHPRFRGFEAQLWLRVENLLDYAEAVQFSNGIQQQEARERMEGSYRELERVLELLQKPTSVPNGTEPSSAS